MASIKYVPFIYYDQVIFVIYLISIFLTFIKFIWRISIYRTPALQLETFWNNCSSIPGEVNMIKAYDKVNSGDFRGFTIIEMLVVVLIIAILVAIALPSFTSTIKRYRVNAAASQIAHALQFARASAIRTRSHVGVSNAAGCDAANWNCGIDVWRDPNNSGEQDTSLTNPANPLKTIPATALQGVNVEFASAGDAGSIIYGPLGFAVGANGVIANTGAIHVWPSTEGDNPEAASYARTICLGAGGKVSVMAGSVSPEETETPSATGDAVKVSSPCV
ncbi:MAG: GspH/FimT family pseudopilin [Azonexus sp.]|jgi:type IV fimbrial biogenesis protein FimT|nr:GspH/FimT family pseudopilin [Azonexus sp.]